MPSTEVCSHCKGPLSRVIVDSVQASHGDIRVSMRNIPMDQCSNCGKRQFPHGDIHLRFMKTVGSNGELKYAHRKGFFSKTFLCCNCKAELNGQPQTTVFPFAVQPDSGEPVQVEIAAPTYTCMCGTKQFEASATEFIALAQAVAAAVKSAEDSSSSASRPAAAH